MNLQYQHIFYQRGHKRLNWLVEMALVLLNMLKMWELK